MKTSGLGGVFIGPADLAASLGHLGNPAHPDVQAAIVHIAEVARSFDLPVGTLATTTDFAEWAIRQQFEFVAVGQDTRLLVEAISDKLNHFIKE
mgnify:CR=1 FL=1